MTQTSLWRSITLLVMLLFTAAAYAVEGTGNIVGSLENTSSSSYTVSARDASTGRSRATTADADGDFRFSQLPVGTYEVVVERNGVVVARDSFGVSINGNTVARFILDDASIDEITVTAAAISGDVYSTDSGVVLERGELDIMPVARNLTSVSMLAPGVVLGDSKFALNGSSGYASFGGSSVAENSCYINGLEVTNTRQGLGCGSVPFEFYQQFQVKTGGYSAQYGRTTGGVLNAVTRSGSNDWEFGVGMAIEPKSMYEEGKVSRGGGGFGGGVGGPGTGRVFRDTTKDESDLFEYWASASGPIIQDRLFVYALVNPRIEEQNFSWQTGSREQYSRDDEYREITKDGSDNVFWGAKIDWDINDYHRVSAWGYSNRSDGEDVHYAKDSISNEIDFSQASGTFIRQRGGEAQAITYTGTFMDAFTISAMYGEVETEYTSDPDVTDRCPTINDNRTPAPADPITGCGPGGTFGANSDNNTQIRLDLEWAVGDHLLRVGLDQQDRDSIRLSQPIGGHNWTYSTLAPNATIQGNNGPIYTNNTGAPQEYTFDRLFTNAGLGGMFNSELTAYYIEDEWQFNDNFVLYLGARKDQLTNYGTTGIPFADFDQEWAPRLGVSWSPGGDADSKVFSTWGRYFLPVPNNTNFRVGSGVSDTTTYYLYTGVDSTDGQPTGITPINGSLPGSTIVNSASAPPTKDQFQAQEADAFFKEEFILGYERELGEGYMGRVRYVNRTVGATLDDYCGVWSNPGYCTMVNPGFGGSWSSSPGGELVFYDADTIGLPKGKNDYDSMQLELQYAGDRLSYNAIYVWSQSRGNFEGAVKSDIVQVDAGITQDFDFPALMDGADGYLPNDRRHVFKFYGSYSITDKLSAGWNAVLASGRPLSVYGAGYPDTGANVFGSYGDTYYLFTNTCNLAGGGVGACPQNALQEDKIYTFQSRGTAGRTPWTANLDASMNYDFEVSGVQFSAALQVFNILNIQEATSINEHAEARRSEGNPNEWYGAAYNWQQPRRVRLSIQARF
ncbi:MAG: carboxypeptidase regulatory-like domain-containing protein [Woeseiaceae bacterium]